MKSVLCFVCFLLLALSGCKPDANAPSAANQAGNDQALKTLQDLGVTPDHMVELAKADLARKQALAAAGQPEPAESSASAPAIPTAEPPLSAPSAAAPAGQAQPLVSELPIAQPAMQSQTVAQPATVTTVPVLETAGEQQPAMVVQQVGDFYAPLTPYGFWVDVPGYGHVWQPSVTLADTAWRPYCHAGHWVSTDCGWYWQSDYSWGWAPFHYGRWCFLNHYRWVWLPDTVWAPAWVSWRHTDAVCGWAPLPPTAHFRAGIGIEFGGDERFDVRVGLSARSYTFVSAAHFGDRNIFAAALTPDRVEMAYRGSTFVGGAVAWNAQDRRVHLAGPDRDWIARETRQPVRPLHIVTPPAPAHAERPRAAVGGDRTAPAMHADTPARNPDMHRADATPGHSDVSPRAASHGEPAAAPAGYTRPVVESWHPSPITPVRPASAMTPTQPATGVRAATPSAPDTPLPTKRAPQIEATPAATMPAAGSTHPAASDDLASPGRINHGHITTHAETPVPGVRETEPTTIHTPAVTPVVLPSSLPTERARPASYTPAAVPAVAPTVDAQPRSFRADRSATTPVVAPTTPTPERSFPASRTPTAAPAAAPTMDVQPRSFRADRSAGTPSVSPAHGASTPASSGLLTPDGRDRDKDPNALVNPGR